MKFRALPVTSLEDATVNFEQLQTLDILNLTAESVVQLSVTGTKRKDAFGSATATFTASANSATVTVTHGLGVTPVSVQLTASGISGVRTDIFAALMPASVSSTQFQFIAFVGNQGVTSTGTSLVYWRAIG